MKSFNSKVAAITGAGSGIGRHLALQLAQAGAKLALADWNIESLEETQNLLQQQGYSASIHKLDVANREAVYAFCEAVIAEFGQVDLVFNNAGVALGGMSVAEVDYEQLEWIFGINLWGVIYGSKAFLPHLLNRPEGYIVNISSVFGLIGIAYQAPYCTTKFAVRGFTESLKAELIDTPIKAMSVHPGGIKTNIARNARGGFNHGEDREAAIEQMERNFKTTPEEAARTILNGIKKGKTRVKIGSDARVFDFIARLIPERSAYFIKKAMERMYNA
jgi:NADP-dependent 3-hydroxy acid dehydrogenase YdfG